MAKKIIITLFLLSSLSSIIIFSYFENYSNTITTNINSEQLENPIIININNEYELIKASINEVFIENNFNSNSPVVIKLLNDITLTQDLFIDRDCIIDFNTFTIDLNNFSMNIIHKYHSNLILLNGQTINGLLYIDVVNSIVSLENFTYSSISLLYDFNRASSEIKAFIETYASNYYYQDIFLINNYKNYPIEIKYTSSNPNLLSNEGKIGVISNEEEVILTVLLKDQFNELEFNLNIKLVNDLLKASILTLEHYLSKYCVFEVNFKYCYENSIFLINRDEYYNVRYYYYVNDNYVEYLELNEKNEIIEVNVEVYDNDFNYLGGEVLTFYSSSNVKTVDTYLDTIGLLKFESGKDKELSLLLDSEIEVSLNLIDPFGYYKLENNVLKRNNDLTPNNNHFVYIEYTFNFETGYPLILTSKKRVYFNYFSEASQIELTGDELIYYELFTLLNSFNTFDYTSFNLNNQYEVYFRINIPSNISSIYPYTLSLYDEIKVKNGLFEIEDFDFVPPVNFKVGIYLYFNESDWLNQSNPYLRELSFELFGLLRLNRLNLDNGEIDDPLLYEFLNSKVGFNNLIRVSDVINYNGEVILDGISNYPLVSLRGIEYIINLKELTILNMESCAFLNELDLLINTLNLTKLVIKNCHLSELELIPNFPNLTYLDLSNNNLTSLVNLKAYPKLTTLKLMNNSILSYENINVIYNVTYLYLDAFITNEVLIDPLVELKHLKEVNLFNSSYVVSEIPLIEEVFTPASFTKYITMYINEVKFYYEFILLKAPHLEFINTAIILESIYYFNTSTNIIIPTKLFINSNNYYELNYTYLDKPLSESLDFSLNLENNLVILSNITVNKITLKVSINSELYRELTFIIN